MALPTIEGLSTDRVQDSVGIDFDDISCSICRDILWKPVACQSCDTPFCSACIARWLETNPRKCPLRCAKYTEKACNRFVNKQLAKLQITCIYQSSGCQEVGHTKVKTILFLSFYYRLFHMKHSRNTKLSVIIESKNVRVVIQKC